MARSRTTDAPLVVYGANVVRELLAGDAPVERVVVGAAAAATAELEAAARRRGLRCEVVDRHALDRLAGTAAHQGAVAVVPPFGWTPLEALVEAPGLLVLDGVQDPRNLGAIVRTARAAGIAGIVVPQDRSVGITAVVVAASAGTVFGIRVARVPNLVRAIEGIKDAGGWTVGLVPQGGTSLYELDLAPRTALVVGGEGEGLRRLVRRSCDYSATIPMAPGVESLNVSVATGIALFELRRRGLLSRPA
jgi:23S rRNA (guanosine2251-2'-O)-methyltransferase